MGPILALVAPVAICLVKKLGELAIDAVSNRICKVKLGNDADQSDDQQQPIAVKDQVAKSPSPKQESAIEQFNLVYTVNQIDSGALADTLKAESKKLQTQIDTLQTQIATVQLQIASMSLAKLTAAFDFLKQALIDFMPFVRYKDGSLEQNELNRALRLIHQAYVNASEAFHDTANVPLPQRTEALQLMLFCNALEYFNKPEKVILAWENTIMSYLRDPEVKNEYKQFVHSETKAGITKDGRAKPLLQIFGSLAVAVDVFKEYDPSIAEVCNELMEILYRPDFISNDKEELIWMNATGFLNLPNGSTMPFRLEKSTVAVCKLPRHFYARLRLSDECLYLSVVQAWTSILYTKQVEVPYEKDETIVNSAGARRLVYLPPQNLIILLEGRSRNISYFQFDEKTAITSVCNAPVGLPTKLTDKLLAIDSESVAFISIHHTGTGLFCTEISTNKRLVKNYLWTNEIQSWKEISGMPEYYTIRCVIEKTDESFITMVRDRATGKSYLAKISNEGVVQSLSPFGLRNQAIFPILSSDRQYIYAYSEINRRGNVVRFELDMHDRNGNFIGNVKLPDDCWPEGFCEVGGIIIVADSSF